jgi:hypothetical protein
LLYLHVVINMKLWHYHTDAFPSLLIVSRSTAQLLSHWLFTTKAWVESQVNPLGFEVEKVTPPGQFFFH